MFDVGVRSKDSLKISLNKNKLNWLINRPIIIPQIEWGSIWQMLQAALYQNPNKA